MPLVLNPDPFNAVLLDSPPLVVTDEQKRLIKEVLDTAASDSKFSEKAYNAIARILAAEPVEYPKLSSIDPQTIPGGVGAPPVTITATGAQFTPNSKIYIAGIPQLTTFVSDSELTIEVYPETMADGSYPFAVVDNGIITDNLSLIVTVAP